jgi:hypothetical protein
VELRLLLVAVMLRGPSRLLQCLLLHWLLWLQARRHR